MVATLKSTTTIITIRITISTVTSAAMDKVIGNTTRNIGEMLRMGIDKPRINLAGRVLVAQAAPVIVRVASGEPVVRAGLVELAA